MIDTVDSGFDAYDFAEGVRELQRFSWSEFCDWYIELAKLSLNGTAAERLRAQQVLATVLGSILRLLHPVVPFVTEELWERLGGEGRLITAAWPIANSAALDPVADAAMEDVIAVVSAIRRFRSEHSIAPSKRIVAYIKPSDAGQSETLQALAPEIRGLAGLSELVFADDREPQSGEQRLVAAGSEIVIPFADLIDVDAAMAQLDRQVSKLMGDLDKVRAKLGDSNFTDKAPEAVVAKQREREVEFVEAIAVLRAQRSLLAGE